MNNNPDPLSLSETLEDWAGILTRRSMHDFLTFMHKSNLSMPHLNILMQLYYHGPVSLLALRSTLLTSRAAATQLVDKLVVLQLVERSEDPVDRRIKVICLTPTGRQLIEDSLTARKLWFRQLADEIPADEQPQISAAVQRLIELMGSKDILDLPPGHPHHPAGYRKDKTGS